MKILYMGTPDFAVLPLQKLINGGHNICGVITREDKPKGRGMKVLMTPVKEFAITENIPVFQPTSLKNGELEELLKELSPELIVVVAYGKILPKYVLDFPKFGCINLHGSLLPKYRGSAPIQRAVLNGDEVSGVTTMLMDEGLDTGAILLSREAPILQEDTSESMFDKLSFLGADLLLETVNKVSKGEISPKPQEDSLATYAPPIKKEDARIDWGKPTTEILNLIRGSFSWPIAFTQSVIGRIKVFSAVRSSASGHPGEVLALHKNGLEVATGDGSLIISGFQVESGKRMSPVDYFRGHDSIVGSYFE